MISLMYNRSSPPRILPQIRSRCASWPARSAGMNVHARPRWSGGKPQLRSQKMVRGQGWLRTRSTRGRSPSKRPSFGLFHTCIESRSSFVLLRLECWVAAQSPDVAPSRLWSDVQCLFRREPPVRMEMSIFQKNSVEANGSGCFADRR